MAHAFHAIISDVTMIVARFIRCPIPNQTAFSSENGSKPRLIRLG